MDQNFEALYQILQKLTGLHRKLLDVMRTERDALVQVNLQRIQEMTALKQELIESIYHAETLRLQRMNELCYFLKKPLQEFKLADVIIEIQGQDLKAAEQFRTLYNVLTLLIRRITDQNQENRGLLERSFNHVQNMKKNILSEDSTQSGMYTPQGEKGPTLKTHRFISQEA